MASSTSHQPPAMAMAGRGPVVLTAHELLAAAPVQEALLGEGWQVVPLEQDPFQPTPEVPGIDPVPTEAPSPPEWWDETITPPTAPGARCPRCGQLAERGLCHACQDAFEELRLLSVGVATSAASSL